MKYKIAQNTLKTKEHNWQNLYVESTKTLLREIKDNVFNGMLILYPQIIKISILPKISINSIHFQAKF